MRNEGEAQSSPSLSRAELNAVRGKVHTLFKYLGFTERAEVMHKLLTQQITTNLNEALKERS